MKFTQAMCHVLGEWVVKVAQLSPTLCDPMDCSPPGSSVHGILQARVLEWVAMPFSRGSSQLRDRTQVSCIAGDFFTVWAAREACQVLEKSSVLTPIYGDSWNVGVVTITESFLAQNPVIQVRPFSLCINTVSAHFRTITRHQSPSVNLRL